MPIYSAFESRRRQTILPGKLGEWELRYVDFCNRILVFTAWLAMLPMVPITVLVKYPLRAPLSIIALGGSYAAKYALLFMACVMQAAWVMGSYDPFHPLASIFEQSCEIGKQRLFPQPTSGQAEVKKHNALVTAVACILFLVALVPLTILTLPLVGWVPQEGTRNHDLKQFISDELAIVHRAFVVFVPVLLLLVMLWSFTAR